MSQNWMQRRRRRRPPPTEPETPTVTQPPDLANEIRSVLNRHSAENVSNTPDYILAGYLIDCLTAYEAAVVTRDEWHGFNPMR